MCSPTQRWISTASMRSDRSCRACERNAHLKALWGCDEDGPEAITVQRGDDLDPLTFRRCPRALLRESPHLDDLATRVSWIAAAWHEGDPMLLTDGAHLSAIGHDALRIWLHAEGQRDRERVDEMERERKKASGR